MALSEMEDLRSYVQERLLLVDPSLDVSPGSRMDTVFIAPLLERLGPDPYNTDIRSFILGRLSTEFPDLVLQDGEPLDDYLIKPLQILLEPFRRQIKQVSNNQSFQNPSILSEKEADALGTNFFARRELGGFSVGVARLYYSAPQYALVTPSNPVYDGGALRFFPVENQAITAEQMLFNLEGGLYFFDIVVRSENQGSQYNIGVNALVGIEDAPAVVKVTNKAEFSEGKDKEATEDFVVRVERSLTEKSLVTWKGITARLNEVFDNIRFIQVIGLNDPEMNRDILKGTSEAKMYAAFTATTGSSGTPQINLDLTGVGFINDGDPDHDNFLEIGVVAGDVITYLNKTAQTMTDFTVTDVVSGTILYVTPNITPSLPQSFFTIRRKAGKITLSDIPGGILQPTTQAGTIELTDDSVHIGGMLDVYVRAGNPQTRETNLEGILDGSPLHFGVDLESFGNYPTEPRVHVTRELTGQGLIDGYDRFGVILATENEILVRCYDKSDVSNPWVPTSEDVGRYIQLLGGNPTDDFGTFKIEEVMSEEFYLDEDNIWHRAIRIKIDPVTELESGSITTPHFTSHFKFELNIRLLDQISFKNRVRDRDGTSTVIAVDDPNPGDPEIVGGVDFTDLNGKSASIGDSVVLETGDDAGIYSIRRILSWLAVNDTLILDRDLTKTVTPLGTGAKDGIRYRIADELNVDMLAPRTTKIPLGSIFSGVDLLTTADSTVVNVNGDTNFLLAGVEIGDTLEILAGDSAGKYTINSVSGTSLELATPTPSTGFAQSFSVYRLFTGVSLPLVRVKSIELLDSNSQPTGIKIPYGDTIDARALSLFSNREEATVLESYTGQLTGAGLLDLVDANIDFVAEGVVPGHRLNVLSTSSAGSYTIMKVGTGDGLPSDSYIQVASALEGGTPFRTAASSVHYSVGQASAGWMRLYFQEPTSVEIQTGLLGGRIRSGVDTYKYFRFSEVDGYQKLPAGGSEDDLPRDLRVVQTRSIGGGDYESILELTEPTRPGVFELEVQVGDVIEAHQEIQPKFSMVLTGTYTWPGGAPTNPFTVTCPDPWEVYVGQWIRKSAGSDWFEVIGISGTNVSVANPLGLAPPSGTGVTAIGTFKERGIFGKPAGLRTLAGSNLVSVPSNSLIDFVSMNVTFPLAGQILRIDSGPDAGQYTIEEVVDSKSLRLNTVMTATTETVLAREINTIRDATLDGAIATPDVRLTDLTDGGVLTYGAQVDHKITIFESTRADLDGTYNITDATPAANSVNIEATFTSPEKDWGDWPALDPFQRGMFSWVRTESDDLVEQPFHIYEDVPTELEVREVATKRPDDNYTNDGVVRRGYLNYPDRLGDSDAGYTIGGLQGDAIEILSGIAAGVYWLNSDTAGNIATIHQNPSFPASLGDVPYRLWSGLHGSKKMVTVGPRASFNGKLEPGTLIPYILRRTGVYRISSTEMQNNFDGTLYYCDVQVESEGSGDDLNLAEETRLEVTSGLTADGYTYSVVNNQLTFSPYEEVSLNFDRRFLPVGNSDSPENLTEVSGRNLRISYESSTPVRLVNDLMRSDQERPVCANPIAKHFLPSYIYFSVTYSGGASEEEIGADLEDYINGLGGIDQIEISDLETFITKRGADYVKHPLFLVAVTHDIDRKLIVDRTQDRLGGLNLVPFNGTGRIAAFFTTLGETLILVRES